MSRARNQPPPSSAPIIVLATVVGAAAMFWKGWPGVAAVWLGLIVTAWTEQPTPLTGKKDASGMPTPAGPGEEAALRRFAMWRELRWSLIAPGRDWMPGWPVLASFIGALAFGAALTAAPVAHDDLRWVNGACGAAIVFAVSGARRRTITDSGECPGTRIDTLPAAVKSAPWLAPAAVVAAGVVAWLIVKYVPTWDPYSLGVDGPHTTATTDPENPLSPLVDYGTKHRMVLALSSALLAAGAVLYGPWSKLALEHWRVVEAARQEWKPRWAALKHDPAPWLIDRQRVGAATVDTFMAPSGAGAMTFYPLVPKIAPTIGSGARVAILETPNETSEGPAPGTKHPLRFEVVTWPMAESMAEVCDVTSPDTPAEAVALLIRCALAWSADETGYGRPVLSGMEPLHAEGTQSCVWKAFLAFPDGPDLATIRPALGGLIGANIGAEVALDHRARDPNNRAMYVGALTEDCPEEWAEPGTPPWPERFEQLATEDHWDHLWPQILKQGTHAPTVEHSTTEEATIAGGAVIHQQAFVSRVGVELSEFLVPSTERKVATALQAAPFVSVTGWPGRGDRPGTRHPMAIVIRWSGQSVPTTPMNLAPIKNQKPGRPDPNQWVLTSHVNKAFDDGRLARPELVSARCLTSGRSRGHIWEVEVRLYGGVTLSDVRGASNRIRTGLGVEWLRVAPADDGCVLFFGADHRGRGIRLSNPNRDSDRLIALDWDQAFLDAGVSGVGGLLPELTGTDRLTHNEQVQVLSFDLPSGLDMSALKEKVSKLQSSTNNSFIEVRPGPSAKSVVMLVSEDNPLPDRVAPDFDHVDTSKHIPFATGIEGEPVEWKVGDAPHVLVAGTTGSGKAEPLTNRLPVPISERFPDGWATIGELEVGDEVYAIDGRPTRVNGLSPIIERPIQVVYLSDGQQVKVSPEHLWTVEADERQSVDEFDEHYLAISRLRDLSREAGRAAVPLGDLADVSGLDRAEVAEILGEHIVVGYSDGGDPVYPLGEAAFLLASDLASHSLRVRSTTELAEMFSIRANPVRLPRSGGHPGQEGTEPGGGRIGGFDCYITGLDTGSNGVLRPIGAKTLRSGREARSRFLNGLLDSPAAAPGGRRERHIRCANDEAAWSVVQLARSLGHVAAPVLDRSVRSAPYVSIRTGPGSQSLEIVDVEPTTEVVPMRCISVEHPSHIYMTAGFVPTHNSVMAQSFIYGAIIRGYDTYIIDPVKGGADFAFAKDRSRAFAGTPFEAAALMKNIYEQVRERKDLNASNGVGSIDDLPEDIRPPHVFVFIDEFTSLMGRSPVPKSDDPSMQVEIELIEAENAARTEIGVIAGKIAREARSAGVHLGLGTQKLTAKMLDSIPGGGDLKVNLARTLLGKATHGDRMSALRAPDDAPRMEGDVTIGRGLWEPVTSTAEVIQTWFAPQPELREALVARTEPLDESLIFDLSGANPDEDGMGDLPPAGGPGGPPPGSVIDVGEVEFTLEDLEMDLSDIDLDALEDLAEDEEADDEQARLDELGEPEVLEPDGADEDAGAALWPEPEPPTPVDEADPAPLFAGPAENDAALFEEPPTDLIATRPEVAVFVDGSENPAAHLAHLDLSPVDIADVGHAPDGHGWAKLDAVLAWLDEHPDRTTVIWIDGGFGELGESGRTRMEEAAEMLELVGADAHLIPCSPTGALDPGDTERILELATATEPEPEPEPDPPPPTVPQTQGDDEEDDEFGEHAWAPPVITEDNEFG